jgi:hypothetical protein
VVCDLFDAKEHVPHNCLLVDRVDDGLADVDVVCRPAIRVDQQQSCVERVGQRGAQRGRRLAKGREIGNSGGRQRDVELARRQVGGDHFACGIDDEAHLVDISLRAPVVAVGGKDDLVVRPPVGRRRVHAPVEAEWTGADGSLDADAVERAAEIAPARRARVVVGAVEHGGGRQEAERADEGQLLQRGVVCACELQAEDKLADDSPAGDCRRQGKPVVDACVRVAQRGVHDHLEVARARSRIPRLAVVKRDAASQDKVDRRAAGRVGLRPGDGERGLDAPVSAVRNEPLVHPVVRHEFVGAVGVGIHRARVLEDARLGGSCHRQRVLGAVGARRAQQQ